MIMPVPILVIPLFRVLISKVHAGCSKHTLLPVSDCRLQILQMVLRLKSFLFQLRQYLGLFQKRGQRLLGLEDSQ